MCLQHTAHKQIINYDAFSLMRFLFHTINLARNSLEQIHKTRNRKDDVKREKNTLSLLHEIACGCYFYFFSSFLTTFCGVRRCLPLSIIQFFLFLWSLSLWFFSFLEYDCFWADAICSALSWLSMVLMMKSLRYSWNN